MSLITNQNQLEKLCRLIEDKKVMALDTEFMRERTYYPLLCLIQVNVDNQCFAIDVLDKNLDLNPFFELVKNHEVIKILHCVHQDLEVLFPFLNQIPKAILDTQIMANFCGLDYNISYVKLVKELLDKEVDKAMQRSDWAFRPLLSDQIEYALLDVFYLPEIFANLKERLIQVDRLEWFFDEMNQVLQSKDFDSDKPNLLKKFSLKNRDENYVKNVKLLANYRDAKARKLNIPRGFLFKDDMLNLIALKSPKDLDELKEFCSDSKIKKEIKRDIIKILQESPDVVQNVILEEEMEPNLNFKLNEKQNSLYQKSRNLLVNKALEYNFKPEFIINQNNLKMIILGYKKIKDILPGWKYQVFGNDLQKLIAE